MFEKSDRRVEPKMVGSNEGDEGSEAFSDDSCYESDIDGNEGKNDDEEKQEVIAESETKAVACLRLLVFLVLVASAVGVALLIYFYIKHAEEDDFNQRFEDDSTKVLQSIGSTVDKTLGLVDSFVVSIVSHAKASNSTWPMVVLPDFAVRAAKLRGLTKTFIVGICPLVTSEFKGRYESFAFTNNEWVEEGIRVQENDKNFHGNMADGDAEPFYARRIFDLVDGGYVPTASDGPWVPNWQTAPTTTFAPYHFNFLSHPGFTESYSSAMNGNRSVIISEIHNYIDDPSNEQEVSDVNEMNLRQQAYLSEDDDGSQPTSRILYPIVDYADTVDISSGGSDAPVVGVVFLSMYWRHFLTNILPPSEAGVTCVIENACSQSFTYKIIGPVVEYLGQGDNHDSAYDSMETSSTLAGLGSYSIQQRTYTGLPLSEDYCPYSIRLYPSQALEDEYITKDPIIFASAALLIFAFTSAVFLLYDWLVERRQKKVMKTAVHSSAIVSSIFPSTVRDKLFPQDEPSPSARKTKEGTAFLASDQSTKLRTLFPGSTASQTEGTTAYGTQKDKSKPIAEKYPEASVLFGDIVGFSAWTSAREPVHLFIVLEAIFAEFDALARKRGIFKVETIGDCYMAVTGLPEPRKDHASAMCRFAKDCRGAFNKCVKRMAVELGPDTAELRWRVGIHSGSVTAGVLRGAKARFQLFGDTVNTASRMESNGMPDMIHVSQSTADALVDAGKGHWLTPRKDKIKAKGKGLLQTYYVEPKSGTASVGTTNSSASVSSDEDEDLIVGRKRQKEAVRYVDWTTDILTKMLKQIVARRNTGGEGAPVENVAVAPKHENGTVLDEVTDIIELSDVDSTDAPDYDRQADSIVLSETVLAQLRDYVNTIEGMYPDNPFHNFLHASRVAQSVVKLLSRIGATANIHPEADHGITSDPLIPFACVFSALIHDVCHPGVPNMQLVKEGTELARIYKGKSVAEQNSFDVSWDLLLQDQYRELRATIFANESEKRRFRQLVVNLLMATDVMDKSLKVFRNARWDKAFSASPLDGETAHDHRSRKATIVLEHLIQASDVAHTMQHWQVYRKWNECLFQECYKAYLEGRCGEKDPAENWYNGELGFLDFYVIPLAKKLKDCGVFGASSDEYLAYAQRNREEWAECGREVVEEMAERAKKASKEWGFESLD